MNTVIKGNKKWHGTTIIDLHNEYINIFKKNNRNSASHLWCNFILDRSKSLNITDFKKMFSGFCPVSGSPISDGREPFNISLMDVTGKLLNGYIYFCCWPCVCDTMDFVRVDSADVETKSGIKKFNFLVIKDPCVSPEKIPFHQTPEIQCLNGKLKNTYLSNNGYIIIGLFFNKPISNKSISIPNLQCQERAKSGYKSGMGSIFRQVAGINKF